MKILNLFSMAALFCSFCLIFIVFFWSVYPYRVVTFANDKNVIKYNKICPGQSLRWDVDIFHLTDNVQVDVSRQMVDGYLTNFPSSSYVTKYGHQKFTSAGVDIPKNTPYGTYRMTITSQFHVNPIRVITVRRETDKFEVVKCS